MPEKIYQTQPSVIQYQIGEDLILNTHVNTLINGERVVELEHRLVLLLVYFIAHHGEVLQKDVLLKTVWQNKVVNDDSLAVAISHLRKALGDNSRAPQFIKTIPGVGYQFIAKAEPLLALEKDTVAASTVVPLEKKPQRRLFSLIIIASIAAVLISIERYERPVVPTVKALLVHSPQWQAAYQKASTLLAQSDPESWRLAIKNFRDLISSNGESAEAYLGIANAKVQLLNEKIVLKENCSEVMGLLQKSLQLDLTLAAAHRLMANVTFWCQRDYVLAEQQYLLAIKFDPADDAAHIHYSQLLLAEQRFSESLAEVEKARLLNPLHYSVPDVVWLYQMQGRDDLALHELERILTTEPDNRYYHISAQRIFQRVGDSEKAFAQWQWLMRDAGFSAAELHDVNNAFMQGGLVAVNRWLLMRKEVADLGEYTPPLSWARYALIAGDYDLALDYLEAAYAQRQSPLLWAGVDPAYEPVRNTERFQRILVQLTEVENK